MTLPTVQPQVILCLCPENYHWKLIPGYAAAFRRRGFEFFCIQDTLPFDVPLDEILKLSPGRPSWIFHFESALPLLPQGLESSPIPTVCFHADTYVFTRRRIRWSYLFDHVAVFHPGYDRLFTRAGHPDAFLLPYAVRREFFDGPELLREFEVGWVGQNTGHIYRRRAEWLPRFAAEFCTNDLSRHYSLEEVADVYRRSQIVVNIGRDDYPQDANLRVFEALASGALLLTSLPSELTDLGFQDGVHFIGYHDENEMIPLVRKFLVDEPTRTRIAAAARAKTLAEHTYDSRAAQLLAHLEKAGSKKLAPARYWPEPRARLMALDFFASHAVLDCAAAQFQLIVGHGFRETFEGAILVAKAWIKHHRRLRNSRA
jgi:hypothetical protein